MSSLGQKTTHSQGYSAVLVVTDGNFEAKGWFKASLAIFIFHLQCTAALAGDAQSVTEHVKKL